MSRLFNNQAAATTPAADPETASPAPKAKAPVEVGLFSDQAKADMHAAKAKAKAVAKERAKQASDVANQVANRARAEWLPKAKAWIQAERDKGVRKGVWVFGGAMALLTVLLSAGIWWHAQPHVTVPTSETPKVAAVASAVHVNSTPSPINPRQVLVQEAPSAQEPAVTKVTAVPVAPVPPMAPRKAAPAAPALKPVPFNPTSKDFHHGQVAPKARAVSAPNTKTAWEKEQEAKLDAFFKH